MGIDKITEFFKWCSIINGSLLILTTIIMSFKLDLYYKIHQKILFQGTKEEYSITIFNILAYWKIILFVFNVVPYLVLIIIKDQKTATWRILHPIPIRATVLKIIFIYRAKCNCIPKIPLYGVFFNYAQVLRIHFQANFNRV